MITGFSIGVIVGNIQKTPTDSFFLDLVPGVLTVFLIEMEIIVAKHFADFRSIGFNLNFFPISIPLSAVFGVSLAFIGGRSDRDVIVLGTLAGSTPFAAAPVVVRFALPKASPNLYLTTSIGITFPIFVIVGISILIRVAG